jgi:glycosyltransferase involved in cell wall biosynthesis
MNPEAVSVMQRVKVLHAVEDLKVGGMERVIASIVTELNPAKYAVHVLCLNKGGAVADELIRQRVPVTILGLDNYHRPGQILALCRWLRGGNYHVLHAHGYFASVFARIAGILVGLPHIITHVHSAYIDYQKKHLFMEKTLSLWTDRIICVSRAVQKWVVEAEKIKIRKTTVIYNGVKPMTGAAPDAGHSVALRQELEIPERDTVFAVIASLTPNKGHHVLLESFRTLLRDHPDATLLVVGDGPLRAELEARARQLMIDQKVIFTGMRTDIHELLSISDVCLLPSLFREGLGMALIEAMEAGLPVIGTDIGGIPEVINNGENGFLVPPGKPEALAHAMMSFAKDKELRIRMGRRSRQLYEEMFTLSNMIRQIETLYDRLSENKHHAVKS